MSDSNYEGVVKFIDWIGRKTRLHFAARQTSDFQEHELWWASFGENIGTEMNGKNTLFERPVVIVKKYSNEMMLAVPCTTKNKNGSWFFPFHFEGREVRAVLAQVRTISSRRLLRKMGYMDIQEFRMMKNALIELIKTDPSA